MEESPRKQQSTSRVIDSLHSQIDDLKQEMETLKMSCGDYKKKSTILASKNDSLVDQLANCKHENDMVNALLKRKERRITDLEAEFDDLSLESESLKQSVKNYKIRCDNLQESSALSTAEFERLKISYDALMASQAEYKRHYQDEVSKLSKQLESYRQDSAKEMTDIVSKLECNDKDVDALLEGLNSKRTAMDNMLVDRNKSILGLLSLLAKVAKTHGEECKSVLLENVEIINALRGKNPELFEKAAVRNETTIDLDALLRQSSISLDTNFADLDGKPAGELSRQASRTATQPNKRKNRNSVRLSPEPSIDEHHQPESLPKQRNGSRGPGRNPENGHSGLHRQSLKRNSSYGQGHGPSLRTSSSGRQPLSGLQNSSQRSSIQQTRVTSSNSTHKTSANNGPSKNSKRRLFYGGNNHLHVAAGEKILPHRTEEAS